MTAELEGSLSKIASLSNTLNEASDQVSKQLAEIESALNAYRLGIEAWVKEPFVDEYFTTDPDKDGNRHVLNEAKKLGYGKFRGKWGLLVESVTAGSEEVWLPETVFLNDAPRETRLKAVDKIPELLEAITGQLVKTTEQASKKAAQAEEIAAALRKKQR